MNFPLVFFCALSGGLVQSASATSTALDTTQSERSWLGISAALILLTFIQLIIAGTYVFRFKKNHFLPGLAIIIALLVALIYFLLNTLYLLSQFIVNADDFFQPLIFSNEAISALFFASGYFSDWTDPFALFAVVLVIRDRYRTYFRTRPNTNSEKPTRSFPFDIVVLIFVFLALANLIFGTASISLLGEANAGFLGDLPRSVIEDILNKLKIGSRLFIVQQTFNSLMILLLIPFAVMVRQCSPKDKIINHVLFGIIPILFLRFIGGIVLLSYINKVLSRTTLDALNIANFAVPSFAYFAVFCVLCYLLLRVEFWLGPGEEVIYAYAPQYAPFPGQWNHYQPPLSQAQPPYPLWNAPQWTQPATVPIPTVHPGPNAVHN